MDRVQATELLDDPSLSGEVVARAYRALARTHRWLGNTGAILRALSRSQPPVHKVLDIGCGQGALLEEIRRKLHAEVIGVDLRPPPASAPVPILQANAVCDPLPRADVAVAVCMAHHLSDRELVLMICNVAKSCPRLILLDLVRHRLPLALFRIFVSPFLPRINAADGVTSIRRSHTPHELRKLVNVAVRGTSARVRHTVAPLYIRQIVDIRW
jgi:2-polyprenyl-3-methyl-5-hydroxy-6-metoxy-1,4-benzoquinol methylase